MRRELSALALATAVTLGGLHPLWATAPDHQRGKSLYQRLGGRKAIAAVVDDFVGHVSADKLINGFFAQTASDPQRLAAFKMKLVDQICEASGGPCKYKGNDMKTAHQGMGISGEEFGALSKTWFGRSTSSR